MEISGSERKKTLLRFYVISSKYTRKIHILKRMLVDLAHILRYHIYNHNQ